ncbi:glutathione S-transferase [Lentibacter algarum]|uniref:glutathione S-transferase n=1 Tax=Lentibacter algarum TaxID=576131 RepID=UPI001C081FD0|nr:glutathione S-transferase [Lentibacter algarum]MBU2983496.1 glutathione S-transferase [Lentibacter algarum]
MTYDLYIGDRAFSSWSMRGWLMLEKFNLPHRSHMVGLYSGTMAEDMAELAPARLVPTLRDAYGNVVFETLAMAETLAEQNPDAGLWPADAAARVFARSMTSEMHAGFSALRGDCPMQLFHQWVGFKPSDAVEADLRRIEQLVGMARTRFGSGGPWLFGQYSVADAFYAPVAARIAGFGLEVDQTLQAYVTTTLSDRAFQQWRALGISEVYEPFPYPLALQKAPWPAT